jgi:hypothetical protein
MSREQVTILLLAVLVMECCAGYWWCCLHPVREPVIEYGHVIADFQHEIHAWEHDQACQ